MDNITKTNKNSKRNSQDSKNSTYRRPSVRTSGILFNSLNSPGTQNDGNESVKSVVKKATKTVKRYRSKKQLSSNASKQGSTPKLQPNESFLKPKVTSKRKSLTERIIRKNPFEEGLSLLHKYFEHLHGNQVFQNI